MNARAMNHNHKPDCDRASFTFSGTGFNRVRVCACGAEDAAPGDLDMRPLPFGLPAPWFENGACSADGDWRRGAPLTTMEARWAYAWKIWPEPDGQHMGYIKGVNILYKHSVLRQEWVDNYTARLQQILDADKRNRTTS